MQIEVFDSLTWWEEIIKALPKCFNSTPSPTYPQFSNVNCLTEKIERDLKRECSCPTFLPCLAYPVVAVDRWGATDDLATSSLHSSRLSAFPMAAPSVKPVHSGMLSSHLCSVCFVFSQPSYNVNYSVVPRHMQIAFH